MVMTRRPVRGRESVLVRRMLDAKMELDALKTEGREFGNAADSAARLYVYVAYDGNRRIEQDAARLVYLTGRARRRHLPDEVA